MFRYAIFDTFGKIKIYKSETFFIHSIDKNKDKQGKVAQRVRLGSSLSLTAVGVTVLYS